ncbi:rhomboid family intramembrane serine protease [Chelativorans sp. YIM 93263]|uniref:rhomboid family intramembrane serine protease n=1 Tax=Chelativorans sp. YIM 93263 TaxID=2906648 RepID=UPI002378F916|nr:rhomboid family intramembrane serine protease [Chelativorans sp. YIM 93263]
MTETNSSHDEETDLETEPRRREPIFNMPGVVTLLIAVCVAVHLVRVYVLSPSGNVEVLARFAFIPMRYTSGLPLDIYAFLSPLTYAFLHGGVAHLAINMIWLAAFGSPLANRIGTARFLLFWGATVLAAVFLHFILHPYDILPLVGASGAISGMMGAAARFGFRIDRTEGRAAFAGPVLPLPMVFRSRIAVVFLVVWMAVNLVVGLTSGIGDSPRIAWEAHIGGFLVGFFFIHAFDRKRPEHHYPV